MHNMTASTLSHVLLFHHLWRALLRGSSSPRRAPLPTELIVLIARLAGLCVPAPSLLLSAPSRIDISAHDGTVKVDRWFATEPLKRESLYEIAQIRLETRSRHQGWANDRKAGSWSWFEIVLYPASAPLEAKPKRKDDGTELVWISHANPVYCSGLRDYVGDKFEPDHQLWEFADVGDVIGVRACAQFRGWANKATEGTLHFWTWFKPCVA